MQRSFPDVPSVVGCSSIGARVAGPRYRGGRRGFPSLLAMPVAGSPVVSLTSRFASAAVAVLVGLSALTGSAWAADQTGAAPTTVALAKAQEGQSGAATTAATPSGPPRVFAIELNTMKDIASGCEASFVFRNGFANSLPDASVEVVLFDAQQQVDRLLVLKPGELPPGKTRVTFFAFQETPCTQISKILVNRIDGCSVSTTASTARVTPPVSCLTALRVSSRAPVPLLY